MDAGDVSQFAYCVLGLVIGAFFCAVLGYRFAADYPGGLTFLGTGSVILAGRLDTARWTRLVQDRPNVWAWDFDLPCPLAVRIGDREFGPAEFASPAAMRAAGADVTSDPHLDRMTAGLDTEADCLTVYYDGQGRLLDVTFITRARRAGSPPGHLLRVGDRAAALPLTRRGLVAAFGRPVRFRYL